MMLKLVVSSIHFHVQTLSLSYHMVLSIICTYIAYKLSNSLLSFLFNVGYTIPKGWKVLVWFRSVHFDSETYPDPREFNPSRWDVRTNTYLHNSLLFFFFKHIDM